MWWGAWCRHPIMSKENGWGYGLPLHQHGEIWKTHSTWPYMDCPGLIILQRVPWWLVVCCFTSQAASYRINNEDWKYANNQMEIPPEYHQKIWEKVLWSDRVCRCFGLVVGLEAQMCVCVNGNLSECQGSNVSHTTALILTLTRRKRWLIYILLFSFNNNNNNKTYKTHSCKISLSFMVKSTRSLHVTSPNLGTQTMTRLSQNTTTREQHVSLFLFIYLFVYLLLFYLRTPTLKIHFHSKLLCWHHSSYCWKKKFPHWR